MTRKGIGIYNLGWNGGILSGALLFSLLLSIDRLDLVLTVPIFSNGLNFFLVIFLFVEQKHYIENNKENLEKSIISKDSSERKRNSNGIRLLLGNKMIISGIIYILFYGLVLGVITTTTTNLYKSKDLAMLIGLLDALRLALQATSSSKIRFEKTNILFKVTGIFIALIGIFVALILSTMYFSPVAFLVIYPCTGFLMGIIYTEAMAILVAGKDDKKKGFLMGIFESMIGVGFFIGPLVAGYITEYFSYALSYTAGLFSIFFLLLVSLIIKFISRKKEKVAPRHE